MKQDRVRIEIKDGADRFKAVGVIARCPRQHSGWQSVTFNGTRYQLFGGVRVNHFIDIANPITKRNERSALYRSTYK